MEVLNWLDSLGLPARTWYNYETGVTVPAEVLLSFIEETNTNPLWLLTGKRPEVSPGHGRHDALGPDARGADQARARKAGRAAS